MEVLNDKTKLLILTRKFYH